MNFAARTWSKAGFRGPCRKRFGSAPFAGLQLGRLLLDLRLLSSGCNSTAAYDMEPFSLSRTLLGL